MLLTWEPSASRRHLPRSASQLFAILRANFSGFREPGSGRGVSGRRDGLQGAGAGRVPAYRTPVTMRAAARIWSQEMASPVSRAAEDMPETGTSSVYSATVEAS